MPTVFEGTPIPTVVIKSAELVVVARFVEVVDQEVDPGEKGDERTLTVARFAIEDAIKGDPTQEHVDVRLVPHIALALVEKQVASRVLLALSPDLGPHRQKDRYVPQFAMALPVDENGRIVSEPERQESYANLRSVDDVRSIVAMLDEEAKAEAALAREAGEDEGEETREGAVTEMPPDELRATSAGDALDIQLAEVDGSRSASPHGDA